jgi:hypothetical protein
MNKNFDRLTPRVSRHNLLLIAAGAWLTAGGILMWRSVAYFTPVSGWPWMLLLAVVGGLLFFRGMFMRISGKHILRIRNMAIERPCLFSFFNFRSYGIMAVMISGGIALRSSHLLSNQYLSLFYLLMSIPLLLSSGRFIKAWVEK